MSQYRILVADDDNGLRALMARRLTRLNGELDQAEDGAAALQLLVDNDYDLIVSDIYMPGATGLDLLRAARDKDPYIQVVVVTAAATLDNAIEALNNGAFGYMIKPFDHISVFDNTIERALEFRRLMLENKRMAAAQKRRGDMLQDEVDDRITQVQRKHKELMDILSSFPDGIIVVNESGRISLSNPEAEKLLAREVKLGEGAIQEFIAASTDPYSGEKAQISLGGKPYQCSRYDLPGEAESSRKLILIQPVIKTSTLPTIDLMQPLEKALEISDWLQEQSHSGRQDAALGRLNEALMEVVSKLLEIDPQLKEMPQELERNSLEIPPEIAARIEEPEELEPAVSAEETSLQTSADQPAESVSQIETQAASQPPITAEEDASSSSDSPKDWPPPPPSQEVEVEPHLD